MYAINIRRYTYYKHFTDKDCLYIKSIILKLS